MLAVRTGAYSLLGLAAMSSSLWVLGCSESDHVATYRVERRGFEHRVTAEGNLKAATTTPLKVPPDVQRTVRLAWLAADGSQLEANDLVARFDPTEMQERLEQGQSDMRSADLEVTKSRVENGTEVAALETQMEVATLELSHAERFQKTDSEVFSRQDIIEDQIDGELAAERKAHAEDSRQTRQNLGQTELDLLAIKQLKAQRVIDQARDGLAALEVRAPHAGILSLTRNWRGEVPQIGVEMWRSQSIAEIPDLTTMEAEVFVLEADAGGLSADKPALVVIESQPDVQVPATIRRVDAVPKPRFRGSPVQFFGVILAFDGEPPAGLKTGQRVQATLILESVEDALVVPRQALSMVEGEPHVFVRNGKTFEPRTVETGASSLGLVEVVAGLEAGETIALSPPGIENNTEESDGAGLSALALGSIR